jgi:DNA polymerase I-like protein with 3'-5' exonuclease and polymerase domains
MILCGGDFDSFEVTIADAVFGDPVMRRDLLEGVSIHTVMAENIYPDKTREQILASKSLADGGLIDMYSRGKQGVFAMLYGGDEGTLQRKLAIPAKVAEDAMEGFQQRYPRVREVRESNARKFACMVQEGGIGTAIEWIEPDDYCKTFLGFKRFFTLENETCKQLYDIAQNPPKMWKLEGKIKRNRDDDQTIVGATCSAIYGAARQLAAADVRAANNHLIQSPGAQITKGVQRVIWDLQPVGVGEWNVAPMNIHDEIMCVTAPDVAYDVSKVVRRKVEEYRQLVPLIALEWVTDQRTWGEKVTDARCEYFMPDREDMLSDLDDPDVELMTFERELDEYEDSD